MLPHLFTSLAQWTKRFVCSRNSGGFALKALRRMRHDWAESPSAFTASLWTATYTDCNYLYRWSPLIWGPWGHFAVSLFVGFVFNEMNIRQIVYFCRTSSHTLFFVFQVVQLLAIMCFLFIWFIFILDLDARTCTRMEVHKFTRAAYEIGARYIGGCCGMEPHHIRAMAQEVNILWIDLSWRKILMWKHNFARYCSGHCKYAPIK